MITEVQDTFRTLEDLQQNWNPNIITDLSPRTFANHYNNCRFGELARELDEEMLEYLRKTSTPDEIRIMEETTKYEKDFLERYEIVKNVLEANNASMLPLTVALNPIVDALKEETSYEDIDKSKWGGIPNFHHLLDSHDYVYRDYNDGSKIKRKEIKIEEFVDRIHPKCNLTGKPMAFLGQMQLSTICQPIWRNTAKQTKDFDHLYSISPVGMGTIWGEHFPTYETWAYFFYSDYWTSPNVMPQLCVIMERRLVEKELDSMKDTEYEEFSTPPWTEEEYFKFAKDYYLNADLTDTYKSMITVEKRTHSQEIKGWDISFSLDPFDDICDWETIDLIEDHKAIGNCCNKPFQLFGSPNSQQTPKRFASIETLGGTNFHLLHPFISWDLEDEDYSYQGYADLHFSAPWDDKLGENAFWGQLEGTCT